MGIRSWRAVLRLLLSLYWRQLRRDTVTFNVDLGACQRSGRWQHALRLLHALESELRSDVVSYNSAISSCGDWSEALRWLDRAEVRGLLPDIISYNAQLPLLRGAGAWPLVGHLLLRLRRKALQGSTVTFNSAMSICETSDQWHCSLPLLSQLRSSQLQRSLVTYGAAISSCETSCRWQGALGFLRCLQRDLPQQVVSPVPFNAVISACGKCFVWHQVLVLLQEMQELQLELSDVTINSCITALGFSGRWFEALQLWKESVQRTRQQLVLRYNALVMAAMKGGRIDLASALLGDFRARLRW